MADYRQPIRVVSPPREASETSDATSVLNIDAFAARLSSLSPSSPVGQSGPAPPLSSKSLALLRMMNEDAAASRRASVAGGGPNTSTASPPDLLSEGVDVDEGATRRRAEDLRRMQEDLRQEMQENLRREMQHLWAERLELPPNYDERAERGPNRRRYVVSSTSAV